MSGNDGGPELLIGGPERPERAPREPRTGWTRRRRVPRVGLVTVVVVVACIAGFVYLRSGPVVPTLGVEVAPLDPGLEAGNAVWLAGPDSRPTGGVAILSQIVLRLDPGTQGAVTVLGLEVDCTKVTLPARAGDYAMQVQVRDGSRQVEGLAPVTPLATSFVSDLNSSCGAWLARQDLTVTEVTATVAPIQPQVDLTLTIRNDGAGDAALGISSRYGSVGVITLAAGEQSVPAHSQVQVHLHTDLSGCDYLPDPPSNSSGNVIGTSSDYLGLVAMKGVRPPLVDEANYRVRQDGIGPTGVVMSADAVSAVSAALRTACADLGPYITLVAAGGFKVDAATRVLTVHVMIDGSAGRVTDVSLVSDNSAGDAAQYVPLWTTISGLVPDRTGQVSATLRYRLPAGAGCPSDGAYLPAFSVYAHVPVPGGVRTLRFSQFINPDDTPQALAELCPH